MYRWVLAVLAVAVVVGEARPWAGPVPPTACSSCRFAKQYDMKSIYTSSAIRDKFIQDIMRWEGQFHSPGVGYNQYTGYTNDGTNLDYTTGLPNSLHYWTAPSKESIHLMMIALALSGNPHATTFLAPDACASNRTAALARAFDLLDTKIRGYFEWNTNYPGYGGYHPWMYNRDTGLVPADGWAHSVPALDNGELIWAIYAVMEGLDMVAAANPPNSGVYKTAKQLSDNYRTYWDLLVSTAKNVFYVEGGHVMAVTKVKDNKAMPTADNFDKICDNPNCYLDDPYEGELYTFFLDLFTAWPNSTDRALLWINKRAKLQSVEYLSPKGPITVQRGWWFSSHELPQTFTRAVCCSLSPNSRDLVLAENDLGSPAEGPTEPSTPGPPNGEFPSLRFHHTYTYFSAQQWKYLELPYLDVEINRRVFINGERARTFDAYSNSIPGLFASVNDVCQNGSSPADYDGATGIQSIAFEPVQRRDVVTPYGAYPVMLADLPTGLAWYYTMINGVAMQNQYGSTEGAAINGTMISPVVTWDSKITSAVAMLGGVKDLTSARLAREGKLGRFQQVVTAEWSRAFPSLNGESIPFQLPSAGIPRTNNLNNFPGCQ